VYLKVYNVVVTLIQCSKYRLAAGFSTFSRLGIKVVSNQSRRSSISVSWRTKNALDSIKHSGQSYDGLIQELVKSWEEKKSEHRTRRKEQRGK